MTVPGVVVVTPADVEARWRPLSAAERPVAQVLLDDAAVLLTARRPRLAADVAAGLVDPRLVVVALADAVQRVLRNPDVQSSINLGADGSLGQAFAAVATARPRLELTDRDLAPLTPAGSGPQAFTVRPRPAPHPLY